METPPALTRRERVILAHLALPLTLGEIAGSLFVTRNTVKTQVRSVYHKLGVSDRCGALAAGRAHGLIPAEISIPEPAHEHRSHHGVPRQQQGQTSTR
jgi:DNA-binding CsgD family transcriptional regulator